MLFLLSPQEPGTRLSALPTGKREVTPPTAAAEPAVEATDVAAVAKSDQSELPAHAFLSPADSRPLLSVTGTELSGRDPWVGIEDGKVHLYYTDESCVWSCTAEVIDGAYSERQLTLNAAGGFTACRAPFGWIALYVEGDRLSASFAARLGERPTVFGPVLGPELVWESAISNPSIVWDDRLRLLLLSYASKSHTGIAVSPPPWNGRSWLKWPEPVLAVGDVVVVPDPRGGYHAFGTIPEIGIAHAFAHSPIGPWHLNPNNPVLIGPFAGPAVLLDPDGQRVHLIVHDESGCLHHAQL